MPQRRSLLAGAAAATLARPARAQTRALRLGVLTDLGGPYAHNNGAGTVLGVQLAIEEAARLFPNLRIEMVSADFQNKPDVALTTARTWYDRQDIDVIIDVPSSSAAQAIGPLARERDKLALFVGPADSSLTGKNCGPNQAHWVYDSWALANCTGRALVQAGGDTWFFVLADYAFGHALANDTARFVEQEGGKVLGRAAAPFPQTTDFSAFLLQAQASKAKVVAFANGGTDVINCIKQAAEFGLAGRGQRVAALLFQLPDLHALGLKEGQGIVLSEAFYWDLDDGARAFSARFAPRLDGRKPGQLHAGAYSATLHYLRTCAELGPAAAQASGRAVMERMKAMPTEDAAYGRGTLRQDGRKLHPFHLFQVKSPAESRAPYDYYTLLRTVPAERAFRPLSEGGCSL